MVTEIREGQQLFGFGDEYIAIKFDEQDFFKDFSATLYGGKGVDFIAYSADRVQLVEVKDFRLSMDDNKWRANPSDRDKDEGRHKENKHSLDIEVAQKVAMTISCLYGLWSKKGNSYEDRYKSVLGMWKKMNSDALLNNRVKLTVILHVEGIPDSHSRTVEMKMQRIRDKLKKNLQWLNCYVVVQNNNQAKKGAYYTVKG